MKVLITGHQGYLGTVMSQMVAEAGHEVVGLDSGLFAECVLGPALVDPPSIAVDLRDVTVDQLSGFDAVIHLAALSNDPLGALAPDLTYDINHHASVRLARLAKEAGVGRYLYASTCSVYGSAGEDLVNESAPLKPLTPYAESKVRVEDDVAAIADSGFSPVFLRNATAFGYSPRLRADIVLNNLVGNAVLTGEVRVLSDGTPWRPLVHARDIATAFIECLTAPQDVIHCSAFNVGTEENNQTVAQIAEAAVAAVPDSTLAITGETGADPRSYRVDFSAIRAALPGYRAEWSIAAGARELYEQCVAGNLTESMFRQSFTRLAHLKNLRESGAVDDSLRPVAR
ncbi:NAD-dependent epimerase/dehydratase family protein [Mycobacteroides immunogenum]|uniref:NAD-dependent dehydratase n=1 Tax=Mycobacteroides immunogenum TaxID=83262 RepID=A0A7V8RY98_9MYCO|nr:SDR family oxidoreductase [Mycobacteroides immunogenum]AMT71259.1 NAD-dependent dehydratase [Mycobacteroides immunogenum]ANO04367.1 NAD-dependent dehydratase [Mycobacteroides immunogenum]KIU42544.1 NAD-dependent dehydratase [Mycobacteroides immunogenum]KPG14863.1 NAD-dependent dehydratase [Mycobacteroides immunogenum]KPG15479.1 NAD-dependent dehydratase [Mycobacteroides immunogenum]